MNHNAVEWNSFNLNKTIFFMREVLNIKLISVTGDWCLRGEDFQSSKYLLFEYNLKTLSWILIHFDVVLSSLLWIIHFCSWNYIWADNIPELTKKLDRIKKKLHNKLCWACNFNFRMRIVLDIISFQVSVDNDIPFDRTSIYYSIHDVFFFSSWHRRSL